MRLTRVVVRRTKTWRQRATWIAGVACAALALAGCQEEAAIVVPPTAEAGIGRIVVVGTEVVLDGTGSDTDDGLGPDVLDFHWSVVAKPDGSTSTLSDENAQQPTFLIDAIGDFVFRLVVSTNGIDSRPDVVVIRGYRPLEVTSQIPPDDAFGVSLGSPAVVFFSEPVQPESVSPSTVFLLHGRDEIPGFVEMSEGNTAVVFRPTDPFPSDARITVVATQQVVSLNGLTLPAAYHGHFLTAPGLDTTPPAVARVEPPSGAGGVPTSSSVTATFDEPMQAASLTGDVDGDGCADNFQVVDNLGQCVPGTFEVSAGDTALRFTPDIPLDQGETYTVVIRGGASGAADSAGNSLAQTYTGSFSVTTQSDTAPPTVLSIYPGNGYTDVPLGAKIAITFAEPMAPALTGSFSVNDGASDFPVTPSYSAGNTFLTLAPDILLDPGREYTVTARGDGTIVFSDVEGNALDGDGDGTAGGDFTSRFVTTTRQTYDGIFSLPDGVSPGETICISLSDFDLDVTGDVDTVDVIAVNDTTGELEAITLVETAVTSGVFEACVDTQFAPGPGPDDNGIFNAQPGESITFEYTDAASAQGPPALVTETVDILQSLAGITVSSISGTTTEAGGSATFTVVLDSQPFDNVVVSFNSNNTAEGTVDVFSLTFTPSTWNIPQTVTVTGVDDDQADGDQTYIIVFGSTASNDGAYASITPLGVVVINVDDETASFVVSAISGPTTEAGGTATFSVALASQPTANVALSFDTTDASEGTVNPTALTFTDLNWNAPQIVTVTGQNDAGADGDQLYYVSFNPAVSSDPTYSDATPPAVQITNIDDESAGFLVSAISGDTTEAGGTATFSVVLNSQPTADVTVNFASNDSSEGAVSPTSLTFTSVNWNAPQVATVTGVDDALADGDQTYAIAFSGTTSADGNYAAIRPADVTVANVDNETAGITVSAISGSTTEAGGTATFSIVLNSQPTANVTLYFGTSDNTEGIASVTGVTFTTVNWNAPQSVTVTGQDDFVQDGNQPYTILFVATSTTDSNYASIVPSPVQVINVDNDSAGYTVSAISGNTTEAGGAATFSIVLNSQPTADVTVNFASSRPTEGTVGFNSRTFTAANWNAPQIVTVTGQDDFVQDGNQPYSVNFTPSASTDSNYDGTTPTPNVDVTNVDNDSAGYTVSAISGNTTEAGGTATFSVVLNSQPTADVTVNFGTSDASEGTPGVTSLIFTAANWNAPQIVTVSGQDDFVQDGNQTYSIVFSASASGDPNYDATTPTPNVGATNVDNDSAGYTVSAISGNTTEAGGTATFSVVLNSQPTADVTVSFASNTPAEGVTGVTTLVFTAANWNAPRTVTVTGQDDFVQDGDQPYRIDFTSSTSTDPNYDGTTPTPNVDVTNVDNDSAGYTISAISGNTTEAGGTATFTVVLNSQPTADVTVSFGTTDNSEGVSGVTSLTFTAANWNAPRTVTVTGQDDFVQDGNQPYRIDFSPSVSGDPNYDGTTPTPNVDVTNVDNDSAGYTVSAISGNTTEAGGIATFTIVLNSQPTADVTVNYATTNANEGVTGTTSRTFTPANWNAPQIVTVTGQDDFVQDGDQPYRVDFTASVSTDPNYDGTTPTPNVDVTNVDNDSAGYTVSAVSGNTTEAGGTATFTIVLNSQPTANVTVNYATNDNTEGVTSTTSRTFTAANWNAPQTVVITGQDDFVQDGDQPYRVDFTASVSTDPNYDGTTPTPNVDVTNVDNDSAGYTVTAISGNTTEAGGTATFTIVLNSQPTAGVTVNYATNDGTEGVTSTTSRTFTSANWNAPQIVTVTGQDDFVEDGDQPFRIDFTASTSTDPNYDGTTPTPNVDVTNVDNDSAGYTVSGISGNTSEAGGTATFTIVLNSQPTANVTVNFDTTDSTEGVPASTSRTFTAANWNAPQTVTVTGQDDFVQDGDQPYSIAFAASASTDPNYDATTPFPNVDVTNVDNDTAGYTVSAISGSTSEAGGTATFSVVLNSQPTANVTVGFDTSDSTEGVPGVTSLVFTTANWNAPQIVTVTGQDDFVEDGDQPYNVAFDPSASTDPNYDASTPFPNVSVTNIDNDTAGYTVSAISGSTTEAGGSATFSVVLNSQPTADVTVYFDTNDNSEGIPGVTSLTFTAANWSAPRTVTVTGQDDAVQDGDQPYNIVFSQSSSGDTNYDNTTPTPNVSVSNVDNDSAGYTVSTISGNTTEAGGTATFTVVLNSQPTANVTVSFGSNDTGEGTAGVASLLFTGANWNAPRTVTVTGQDDFVQDGNQPYQIVFSPSSSGDTNYNNTTPTPNVSVTNVDNDSAGYTVSTISGNTTEAGGTATFTVVLNSQPTADVTVNFDTNDTTEGVPGVTSLTFTAANWNAPRTVTVTGQDDAVQDGDQPYSIVFSQSVSGDTNYQNTTPTPNVGATNIDNDSAGYTVSTISGNTTEAGGTATFTVVLNSQPTADVVVSFDSNDPGEGTVSATSFTFTSANWNAPRTVTVTGQDDAVQDGDQPYNIVFSQSSSGDTNYDNTTPTPNVDVTNVDNDSAGYTVSTISQNTTEAGGTGTITVVLNSQPTAPVTVSFDTSDSTEGVPGVTSLNFTAVNWNAPQTVTITGQDDAVQDGDQPYSIVFAPSVSGDPNYGGTTPTPNVTVANIDNDSAGYTVSAISQNTTEAGGTATFTVVLNSEPTANVVVSFDTSDSTEGVPGATSLTFTAANWNAPQTVTVTGQDDAVQDGDQPYTISFTGSTSGDTNYGGTTPTPNVGATNIDNDSAGYTVSTISGSTTEAGGTATFTVVLNSQPTANVTVNFGTSDSTEGVPNVTNLQFTAANWNAPQTVVVTGQDDFVQDGNQPYSIVFTVSSSGDTNYNNTTPTPNVSVSNVDNDSAGYTVSAASGNTTEAGGTATFTVVLNSQPTADVTVNFNTSDNTEGVTGVTSLVFTQVNWNAPRTVTITGQDDFVQDGNQPYTINFSQSTSTDTNYDNTVPTPNPSLNNVDNDSAGYTVSAISGNTTEAGGTATFTVVLNSQPTADVTVSFDTTDGTEGVPGTTSLTFTAANWNAPQIVTLTGQDDFVEDGNQPYSINFTASASSDPNYAGTTPTPNVDVLNVDNDSAGYTVSAISQNTTEAGGTGTFTVVLNSQPTADVAVSFLSTDTTEGTLSVSSLTFTAANWNAPRTVTVTGQDDFVQDGDQPFTIVFLASTSSDPNYSGTTPFPNVSVFNVDNDTAGYTVSAVSQNTTEAGGTGTFTVVLNSQPTASVTVSFDTNDVSEGVPGVTSLTFTTFNWNAPQAVTVTGQDDFVADGNQPYQIVFGGSTSSDNNYNGTVPTPNVDISNTDNDSAGYTVSAISQNTTEAGGTGTFTVVLNSQPTADVVVNFGTNDSTEGVTGVTTLTFTSANWNAPRTVTVTGQDDAVQDGDQVYAIVFSASSSGDTNYNGTTPTPNVSVTNTDNDSAGYTVSAISQNTTEAGGTATFTVVLNSQPTADVVVNFGTNDSTEGVTGVASVTFTSANWNAPRTVTVTGQDDAVQDGDQVYAIVFSASSSGDTNYNGTTPTPNVSVTNTDNDSAGYTVSAISQNTTEAGGTATFTVVLNSQPTADVVVNFGTNDSTEGVTGVTTLTFTSANWNAPRTVTVTGQDDAVQDGDQVYAIVFSASSSGDTNYNGTTPTPNVSVTNTDNDSAGYTVSGISGNTTEAGGTGTFTVVLNSQPTADVVVNFGTNDATEGVPGVTNLTFTAANWNAPRTVTVTGQDDPVQDGDQVYAIVFSASSSGDTNYNGTTPTPNVSVTNTDNDSAGYTVSTISQNTTEAGGTGTFTVVLNSQPTADVTVSFDTNDGTEGVPGVTSLLFTTVNWNAPRTVTVTGQDDFVQDGSQPYNIVFAPTSSGDTNYDNTTPAPNVAISNVDNDSAGYTVSAISGNTTEAGGTATFSVVLNSQPTAAVTVYFDTSDASEGIPGVTSLAFTAVNWNAPQVVTVTGQDDFVADGNQPYSIVFAASGSGDTNYDNTTPAPNVDISNVDNDSAGYTVSTISQNTTEAGGTGTFTVVLNSQPTAQVVVNFLSSDTTEGTLSSSSLTYTTVNWNAPQIVTVTGQDDFVADSDQPYNVVFTPSSSADTSYSGTTPTPNVAITNIDNDSAGYTISAISNDTTEAGGTATFSVVLNSQPTADVTVHFGSNDTSEGTVGVTSRVFTALNWNAPQVVTVTGQDDFVQDGNQQYQIAFSASTSTDTTYNGTIPTPNVTVTNIDNDSAGYTVSGISGDTNEAGGTATFSVVLNSQPTADVTVSFDSNDSTEGTPGVTSLLFTAANWNAPQIVTVTGQDDFVQDGNQPYTIVFSSSTSSDTNYDGSTPTPNVGITNVDNDSAGYTVSGISQNTVEGGGTGTFTVVLNSQPTADVLVVFDTNDSTEGVPGVTSLTFTAANWNAPRIVTVTGQDDAVQDGNQPYAIVFSPSTSGDTNYDNTTPAPNVSITNIDNDSAGYTISAISQSTTEAGGTGTFTVVLTSEPTADVTVYFGTSDSTEGISGVTSLTFTALNWNAPRTVTVTGQDDAVQDGNQTYSIVFSPSASGDTNYDNTTPTPNVGITNIDNDSAGYTVSTISQNTTEAGGTGTFTVVLTSEPTADVVVSFDTNDSSEGVPGVTSLTFTSANWNAPQVVTVTGQDDAVQDGDQVYAIVFTNSTSTDTNYGGTTPTPNVSVTNTDNDSAGYTVSTISQNTTEAGGTATFTVVLNSQPTADVTVNFDTNDSTEGVPGVTSLTFTSANWNAPRTVTVTGQDDAVQDGDQVYAIVFAGSTSTDTNYGGTTPTPNVSVTNTDNDSAGYTVSTISQNTTEAGGTATFTVVLNSQPTANVVVNFDTNDSSEGVPGVTNLTFTAANWNAPQIVTVTGQDDFVQDGNQTYSIVFTGSTSTDTNYGGTTPTPNVSATNTDNDSAGYTVSTISQNTTEAGGTATFTVVLNSQPTADVVVNFATSDGSEGVTGVTNLTFTSANWNAPRTVTVTGQDDFVQDGDQVYSIVFSGSTSTDTNYGGTTPTPNVSVTNTDNDSAGYTVSAISQNTTEAGGTATFTVVLNSQPTANVVVNFGTNDSSEGVSGVTSLTFTSANWNAPQIVTVTGQDDFVQDGNQTYSIVFSGSTSTDTNYGGTTPTPNVSVTNTDNDSAGYTVSTISQNTTEAGGTATFTVVLNSQPTADVTVNFDTNDSTEGVPGVTSLTFTSANWNAPRTVTVTGQDDAVQDGDQTYSIVFTNSTSTDTNYGGTTPTPNVSIANTDNDSAGYTVSAISQNTTEAGGTATFTVVLNSQPTANVVVNFGTNDSSEGVTGVTSLTFTAANWNAPQTVTVTGQDDFVQDGNQTYSIVFATSTSTDTNYGGTTPTPNVSVTNTDNDSAGYTVSTISQNTTEAGGTATFTVVLNSQPTANVTVNFNSNQVDEGTVSVSSLLFTAANWNAPQTVTVTGQDDFVEDGDQVYAIVFTNSTSTDTNYGGTTPTPNVSVTNTDNDSAGYTVSAISQNTTEAGGTATFTVVLNSQPTADVVVNFDTNDSSEGVPGVTNLTFTSANWNAPRTVTVTGQDDAVQDGDQTYSIVFTNSTSTDTNYGGTTPTPNVSIANTDNDSAGYTVSAISQNTTEAGGTATFTVVLNSQPTADVVVNFDTNDATEGVPGVTSLTFTSANWNAPRTVTVTGQDDFVQDGNQTYSIVFGNSTSTDTNYGGTAPTPNVAVTNTDNDSAGYTVSTISQNTTEAGGTATFTVVLNSQPTANVTVFFGSNDGTEGVPGVTSLTFTTANWNAPQTVTVTGQDDAVQDGDQVYAIVFSNSTSTDNNYNGTTPTPNVSVTNTDNDSAGYTISAISQNTTEAGGTATFTVVLNSQPTANVVVNFGTNDGSEGVTGVTDLTFTSGNWSTPQTVTVTGQDDFVEDGDQVYAIVFSGSTSTDTNYGGTTPTPNVSVTNTDNDSAGYTVSAISQDTSEPNGTATFTVVLNSQPTADVTVNFDTNDSSEGVPGVTSLTFTAANWSTPQTVTVTGQDDSVQDGDQVYSIVFTNSSSTDTNYGGTTPTPNVSVTNVDDDLSGYTVSAISQDTTEGGGTGTFTVVLTSQPTASVVVNFNTSDGTEGVPNVTSLTFTTANWSTPQTVTVTGQNDNIDDGDRAYTISFSASSSSDLLYDTTTPSPDVTVTNLDDDTAGYTVSGISQNTTEVGGTATFSVVLDSEPLYAVTVNFNTDTATEGQPDVTSLVFTAGDWNTPQTVTVTGQDDFVDDGNQSYSIVFSQSTSSDSAYNSTTPSPDVGCLNVDNDTAGYTVSAISQDTTEPNGTATFTVVLDSQPTADVTVNFDTNDSSEGVPGVTSLLFTPAGWSTPQTVTVTGQDDAVDDGDIGYAIVFTASSSTDGLYDSTTPSPDVSITNIDDDTAGYTVSAISQNTTEAGGTGTFTVVLTSEPTADVTVNFNTNDATEGTPGVTSLLFTAANWNAAQTVTVTGQDDSIADGDVGYAIAFSASSSADTDYDSTTPSPNVAIDNIDDDTFGYTVSAISQDTTEAGGTATFTVVLSSQPTADVTVNFDTDNAAEGTPGVTSLVFTSGNWNTPQTVTVTGQDESIDDGDQTYNIVFTASSSSDTTYDNTTPSPNVACLNIDNDTAGYTVSTISQNTTEGGGTATFSVVLSSQPTADVTVNFDTDNSTEGTPGVTSLLFTSANWNVAQVVTVTGGNDDIDDGNVAYNIVFSTSTSSDGNYGGSTPSPDVGCLNVDDDTWGFTVSTISQDTTEAGGTATFTVVLDSEPTASVTVNFDTSNANEGTVGVTNLLFTAANWNTPQTVTVTGQDDSLDDGDVSYSIDFSGSTSSDTNYSGQTPSPNVACLNIDDDTAGYTVSTISQDTTEPNGTGTFTVVLSSQPTANVTVNFDTNDSTEGVPGVTSLLFTPINWLNPQTVTVTGQDDSVQDGDIPYAIVFTASSSTDTDYGGTTPSPNVSITNLDDDVKGYTVSTISNPTEEPNVTATFTVVLNSEPTADVTVNFDTNDSTEGAPGVTSLVFTSANWNSPQTVTVTGQDDDVVDGDIGYAIVFTASSSSDTEYDGTIPSPNVSITNIDDDAAGYNVSAISQGTSENGQTGTFTVSLTSQPTANVVVMFDTNDISEGIPGVTSLTFTSANWNVDQTATVTGQNDSLQDGDTAYAIVFTSSTSSDTNYGGSTPSPNVSITNLEVGADAVADIMNTSVALGSGLLLRVTGDTDEYTNTAAGAGNDTITDPGFTITLTTTNSGDSETTTVSLGESTATAGDFDCTVDGCWFPTANQAATANNGILESTVADTITLSFTDPMRSDGSSLAVTDTASATLASPGASCAVSLKISEFVSAPQTDWNDSLGAAGVPFDSTTNGPQVGDSNDEWIEIYNPSGGCTVDLTNGGAGGYMLHMMDGSDYAYEFGVTSDGQVLVFSGGSTVSAFLANTYLVIGDPSGSDSLADNGWIRLDEPSSGGVVDDVAFGTSIGGDDDNSNNAPAGTSSSQNDEGVTRTPTNSTDTDVDSADFTTTTTGATIGS